MEKLYQDANLIIDESIKACMPHDAVIRALEDYNPDKKIYVVSVGKAAWSMAKAAHESLGSKISDGIVLTKYGHSQGGINGFKILEAGHPVPDENSVFGTKAILKLVQNLTEDDELLFLLSGGGSALFESPVEGVSLADIQEITKQLLSSGADIEEINAVRKRLSEVKGGRLAEKCKASIYAVVLSDVIGNSLSAIASGPVSEDETSTEQVKQIVDKYKLKISSGIEKAIASEMPKDIKNVTHKIIGSVDLLCEKAVEIAEKQGYKACLLTTHLNCEAKEAGRMLASIIKSMKKGNSGFKTPCALIFGGETVVNLSGSGVGGRNQELALSAANEISRIENVVIFSVGSDGTDGPTDAAGGIVSGDTAKILMKSGVNINFALSNHDSYNALKAIGALVKTGPTGTNVNDLTVALCK